MSPVKHFGVRENMKGRELRSRLRERDVNALYEIKKQLRSRNLEMQLYATSALESCLRSETLKDHLPLREFMLDEDVVGFICDAMATNAWHLLEQLTSVLELLSDCERMLKEGHGALAAETAQRRAHFLGLMMVGKTQDCEPALCAVLGLLGTLLARWSTVTLGGTRQRPRVVSNLCPPLGLLATLRLVLDHQASAKTTLCAAQTLCGLLGLLTVGAEPVDPSHLADSIATAARAALRALRAVLERRSGDGGDGDDGAGHGEDLSTLKEEAIELICSVASRLISLRASCDSSLPAEQNNVLNVLENVEKEAQLILVEKCLPLVVRSALASIEEDERLEESPFSEEVTGLSASSAALLHSLEVSLTLGKEPAALADSLASQNFLWLLPTVHRLDKNSNVPLRLLCLMLAHLAFDLVEADEWWPDEGGVQSLASFLLSAKDLLPADNRDWPSALERWPSMPASPGAGAPAATQLLVLLLTYFRAVAGSDCDQQECLSLTRSLPRYVMSLPVGMSGQQHLLKMTWISFAVFCVLVSDEVPREVRAANERLRLLLEECDVAPAFTQHPALLYWAFQARDVPPGLQRRLLELWLAGEADSGRDVSAAPLKEILRAQPYAVHPMLDLLLSGDSQAAESAARILCQAAAADQAVAESLVASLWTRLPLELSRCGPPDAAGPESAAGPGSAGGCALAVWLAAEVYQPPPAGMALRLANLLGGALGRRRMGAAPRLLSAAMFILRRILEGERERADPRVHSALLSDTRFIEVVLEAAGSQDTQVCPMALHLLRRLEEQNALFKSPVLTAPVTLDVGRVFMAVTSKDLHVLEAGLLLLVEVLTPKSHPFLKLQKDEEIIKSLFFQLQNHVFKFQEMPVASDLLWIALRELMSDLQTLCQQPWNHTTIKYALKLGPLENLSKEFFSYLLKWLELVCPSETPRATPSRPLPTLLTETCINIANALIDADMDLKKSPCVREIAKILPKVTANLPSDLEAKVKLMA